MELKAETPKLKLKHVMGLDFCDESKMQENISVIISRLYDVPIEDVHEMDICHFNRIAKLISTQLGAL